MPIALNGNGTVTGVAPGNAGFGKVLQVVYGSTSTQVSSSSATYADTGLQASITPTSSTSKILVLVNQNGCGRTNGNVNNAVNLRLLRNGTALTVFGKYIGWTFSALDLFGLNSSCSYLDAPASTSTLVYKTQFANNLDASEIRVQTLSALSTITLMEVAA